jgi:hypothetical protein
MNQVNLQEVAQHVDVAAMIKRHMREAEMERQQEKQQALTTTHKMKKNVHYVTEKALGPKFRDDMRVLACLEQDNFNVDSIKLSMEHCERLMAIEGMWDGIGKFDVNKPDTVIRDLPRTIEWRSEYPRFVDTG